MSKDRSIPITEETDDSTMDTRKEEGLMGTHPEHKDEETTTEVLEERIRELESENESLRDQRLRAVADLDNARRRAEQDVLNTVHFANEGLLKKILPIVDDFERSIDSRVGQGEADPFFNGVSMILNKLHKLMEEQGVEKIDAEGKEFDVEFHEAMMRQPSDRPEGTVLQVLEPGYTYKGKVIRHSKVIVASND